MTNEPGRTSKLLLLTLLLISASLAGLLLAYPLTARAQTDSPPQPTPTPLPDPLEYPLPVSYNPKSSWRPPLYPTPWALSYHDHFYFSRPVGVDEVNWPLPSYRYGGIFFAPDAPHTGVDIVVEIGTPVLAAGPGQVVWTGRGFIFGEQIEEDPYGLVIAIKHDFGWNNRPLYTLYAHLSEILAVKGQQVETGDLIGLSGDTGFTTAPHLHFEVRVGENTYYNSQNPELWLVPPVGWGVVAGRLTDGASQPLFSQEAILVNLETDKMWVGESYGSILTVNHDPYYNENFVVSDLPAGKYLVQIPYYGLYYEETIEVLPGAVTFFRFKGWMGFVDSGLKAPIPTSILPMIE